MAENRRGGIDKTWLLNSRFRQKRIKRILQALPNQVVTTYYILGGLFARITQIVVCAAWVEKYMNPERLARIRICGDIDFRSCKYIGA